MSIKLLPMENQCDLLPRLTIVFPWGPIKCTFIYFGWLFWMIAIQFGDLPYSEE